MCGGERVVMHTLDLKAITHLRLCMFERSRHRIKTYLRMYVAKCAQVVRPDSTRVLFTRMNETTRAQPWPWTRSSRKKGAISPVPPPDCNNAFRAVHKACNRYLGEVVRAPFAFPFSRITLSVTPRGLAVLSLFLSRKRALVRGIYHARATAAR